MTHIVTKHFSLLLVALLAASMFTLCFSIFPPVKADPTFEFAGAYEEGTYNFLPGTATVIVHTTIGTNYTYTVTGGITGGSISDVPLYFEYIYNYSGSVYRRYYWCNDVEAVSGGLFRIFFAENLTPVSFNIFAYSTLSHNFDDRSLLSVNSVAGALNHTVEKVPVDVLGDAAFLLKANFPYDLTLEAGDSDPTYAFGNIVTVSSAVTLSIPVMAFPEATLLQYPYVTFYGTRDLTSNSITLYYNDTKQQTNSFSAVFTDSGGTTAYSYSVADTDSLVLNWTLANDDTTYYVSVEVDHALYGDLDWTQTFYKAGGSDEALFSLSFLGDWSFNTAYILPAFLVLFVAACFSVLNAEAGALLSTIAAIALTLLGWLPIPAGMLVSAFAFSILMALVYAKRRAGMY